jgi:hypothetical protein
MKITRKDLKSLRFAMCVLEEIERQTVTPEQRLQTKKHKERLRKLHLMLLQVCSQPTFELMKLCQFGIPNEHKLARAIRTTNQSIADELTT